MISERDYTVREADVSPYNGGHVRVTAGAEKYMLQGDIETIEVLPDGSLHIRFVWAYRTKTRRDPDPDAMGGDIPTTWHEVTDLDYIRTYPSLDGLRSDGKGILHLATHDGDYTPRHFLHLRPKGFHHNPTRADFASGKMDAK